MNEIEKNEFLKMELETDSHLRFSMIMNESDMLT